MLEANCASPQNLGLSKGPHRRNQPQRGKAISKQWSGELEELLLPGAARRQAALWDSAGKSVLSSSVLATVISINLSAGMGEPVCVRPRVSQN